MLICSISGDVSFDHIVKVISAKFLYCKVSIFLLCNSKYRVWSYFETSKISCFSSYFYSLIFASVDDSLLQ